MFITPSALFDSTLGNIEAAYAEYREFESFRSASTNRLGDGVRGWVAGPDFGDSVRQPSEHRPAGVRMSMALARGRSLQSLPTMLGLLGIVAAAGGLVPGGPVWLVLVGDARCVLKLSNGRSRGRRSTNALIAFVNRTAIARPGRRWPVPRSASVTSGTPDGTSHRQPLRLTWRFSALAWLSLGRVHPNWCVRRLRATTSSSRP